MKRRIECSAKKILKLKILTGAGDLFAAGFFMDILIINQLKKV